MSTPWASLELENRSNVSGRDSAIDDTQHRPSMQPESRIADQALERIDGGTSAWRLLCAAFVFEAILWGELPPFEHLARCITYHETNDGVSRVSTFLRCFSELLFRPSTIRKQSLHHIRWKYCHRNNIPWSAVDGTPRQTLSKSSAPYDLAGMGCLPEWSCCWIVR